MSEKRSLKDYLLVTLKGMGMGAADVVPGVSGGTIAFITGIYEELINAIRSVNFQTLKILLSRGLKNAWDAINGNFLLALFLGIGISVLTLSRGILFLLENHPILIWSFFFGLVFASAILVFKEIKRITYTTILTFLIGGIIAYVITIITPGETPTATWFIFLSGAIAICAMILPGISGSFILLLMGKYEYILGAVKEFNFLVIITFALGCLVGITSFSHVLSWLFRKYHDMTIALLAGFMIGSLNKVWPWKEVLIRVVIDGKEKVIAEANLLPGAYTEITGNPHQVIAAIGLALFGAALIFVVDKLAGEQKK
jgi:putative membrane protein